MKPIIHTILTVSVCAAAASAADSTLVSHFEDQTNKNAIGGFWFYLDDKGSQGNSKVTSGDTTVNPVIFSAASFGDGQESLYSGKIGYTFGTVRPQCGAGCTYSPEVTFGNNIVPAGATVRDITGATAIAFWAKAEPPVKVSIIALTKDVTDFSWARAEVSVTSTWTRIIARLSGTTAPVFKGTWGSMKDKTPNLAQMESFSFALQKDSNPTVTSGYLLIDNLYILNYSAPDVVSSVRRAPTASRVLRALRAADGKSLRFTVPEAYRSGAGKVAAVDLAGKVVAEAAFAKGQHSVSLSMAPGNQGGTSPLFMRVFPD